MRKFIVFLAVELALIFTSSATLAKPVMKDAEDLICSNQAQDMLEKDIPEDEKAGNIDENGTKQDEKKQLLSPIVDPLKLYKTQTFTKDVYKIIEELGLQYSEIVKIEYLGLTDNGRKLMGFKVGNGGKPIFINSAHHGLEWITTILALHQADYICQSYYTNPEVKELMRIYSFYFLPMVNPDGIEFARLNGESEEDKRDIKRIYGNRSVKNKWKSNSNGVDLNRNYSFGWAEYKEGGNKPAISKYKGKKPFSEKETQAVMNLCNRYGFEFMICYHSQGDYIYWDSKQNKYDLKKHEKLVDALCDLTGYTKETYFTSACGGAKDWFYQSFGRQGVTIEVGKSSNGIVPYEYYEKVWKSNKDLPLFLAKYLKTNY